MCKSLKILWVKRLLNEEDLQWKIIPVHYLEKVDGKLIFLCNYELKKLDLDLPPVYKDTLTTWSESKQTSSQTSKDIHNEILWNNRFITINGKSIWWKKWFDQGIKRVSDILGPAGRTLPLADIKKKFNVDDWSCISNR